MGKKNHEVGKQIAFSLQVEAIPRERGNTMLGNDTPAGRSKESGQTNGSTRGIQITDRVTDIDEAIAYHSQALLLTPNGDPNRPRVLSSLGNSHARRFERSGNLEDINKAIDYLSQAVSLTPHGYPDMPRRLSSLGNLITRRFERLGDLEDINKAIDYLSRAVSLTPEGHSDMPGMLSDLGNLITLRFEYLGELADINKAIDCLSQAISLTPFGHLDLPDMFSSLANSVGRRFERLGELTDIDKGIDYLSQAVSLAPEGHPKKPIMLSNLGNLHQLRFDRLGIFTKTRQTTSLTAGGRADNNLTHSPGFVNNNIPVTSLSQAVLPTSDSQETGITAVEAVPSEMSASEVFDCLLEHGCVNISSDLDPAEHSSTAIGGGSFGDVWKGKLISGGHVAIKCLRFTTIMEDHPKSLKRLMRETYMWSKARHDNVQQLMGITMFQGRLGMVSLWREHGNVQEYIRRNPSADRHQLCVQVASAVSYLHSINMVHGDIKALNILVSAEGVAKLSDFDHSILSNCTIAFSATTNLGGGTLRWMAPELVLLTDSEADGGVLRNTKTDIYALGMTLLEIFTNKIPYAEYREDHTIYGVLIRKRFPARPKELTSPTTHADEMWSLLINCWNHDPEARPTAPSVLSSLKSLNIKPPSSM